MDKSGADAFVFAKANGILGKSFVNSRARLLFGQKSLADLWNTFRLKHNFGFS